MREYRKGDIVVGRVTGIKKYGIFVIVEEEISGLIHISEASDKYVTDINSIVSVGDYILVEVVSLDNDKLKLSIKNIDYKAKRTSINLKVPKIKVNPKEFDVLKQFLD